MKTTTIPSVRVEPALREQLEGLLLDGETVSQFVEASVRDSVRRRLNHAEFLARGIRALDDAKHSGAYADADEVVARLDKKLAQARQAALQAPEAQ